MNKKEQFENLVKKLKQCGYLEDEIYAIARIGSKETGKLDEDILDRGIEILNRQLSFAKKCINVVEVKMCK